MSEVPFPDNAWLTYREATQRWGLQTRKDQAEYIRKDASDAAISAARAEGVPSREAIYALALRMWAVHPNEIGAAGYDHVSRGGKYENPRAAWYADQIEALCRAAAEARIGALETSKGRPKDNSRFSKRYSRAEMRDFMDRQGDAFDTLVKVGALCQANDGECTG